jgi:hypothetical protein
MKKSLSLVLVLLFAVIFTASAQNLPCNGNNPYTNCGTPGTTLPVNNNAVYLLIAGVVIGVIAIKRQKRAKKAIVPVN